MGDPHLTLPALCPQYFAFLLLILITQVAAGVLFYFNMDKVSSPSLPPTPSPTPPPPVLDKPCEGLAWGRGMDKKPLCGADRPSRCQGSLPATKWQTDSRKLASVGRVTAGPGPLSTPPCSSCVAAVCKLLASLCPLQLL